jgi:uncharacterized repeat protein (TIGR02543 family)
VTGDVTGKDRVGGLVGQNFGSIADSYATSTVTGTETNVYSYTCVGGLVGNNDGPISNSFARGAVSGQENIGGLVGYNSGSITVSYSTGAVSGDNYIGGLIGSNDSDGIITDSYWDTETSRQTSSDGGTGKTTTEMKQKETFEHWDFINIWDINTGFNNGYPFLRWQNTEAVTAPTAPQDFTATPGDGQVALSWAAPASDGGSTITKYQVSKDNGGTWVTAATNTSHTFTGLINGTEYIFKVRAVNSVGKGTEASAAATPTGSLATAYTVTVNGSYAGTSGAGQYAPDAQVSIHAGSRSNYSFTGWTSPDGVPFANANNVTTTFIMPAKNVTITATWSYNGGGGSGGGGGSMPSTTPPATPTPQWLERSGTSAPIADAEEKGLGYILTRSNNQYGVRKAAWLALSGYQYWHDTMDSNTVQVRVYIKNPTAITSDLLVSGYVKGSEVDRVKAIFEKYFSNKVRTIHLDQTGTWGQVAEIAARVDLAGMDVTKLYLYSYDKATNTYRRIEKPAYWVDTNGYLHFTSVLAGDIIISEGPLARLENGGAK